MSKELGMKLKKLRENIQLSAEEVAKKLKKEKYNYCPQSIYKWEHGNAEPKIDILLALSKIYKCDISYLIEERNLTYKNLTASEIFLLQKYRNDFLFRSIAVQIIRLSS